MMKQEEILEFLKDLKNLKEDYRHDEDLPEKFSDYWKERFADRGIEFRNGSLYIRKTFEYETDKKIFHYPILWREQDGDASEECPFCGETHYHGIGDGRRVMHCRIAVVLFHPDGPICGNNMGYILKSRKEGVGERGREIMKSYRG